MVADISAAPRADAPDTETAVGGRPRRRAAAWVAMYHSVSDCPDDPYNITVTPERLDRQLGWLAGRGLRG